MSIMLSKNDILEEMYNFLENTGFSNSDMAIIAGGSMTLKSQRESTNDIDVLISSDKYSILLEMISNGKLDGEYIFEGGKDTYKVGNISISASIGGFDDSELFESFEGFKVTTDKENLKFYLKLNRDKDQKWIKLLS